MKKYVFVCLALSICACSSDEDVYTEIPEETNNPTIPVNSNVNGVDMSLYFSINFDDLPNYSSPEYPIHYLNSINNHNEPTTNQATDTGAILGRILFFDKQLSINNAVSCASCHQQGIAFTDNERFSTGFDGVNSTSAHSMRLVNARFYQGISFFWDKRAPTLEDQTTEPLINSVEMGFDASNGGIAALITKMNSIEYYPALFEMVFGDATITEDRMQRALAQYIRCMVSTDSKFDQAFAQVYNPNAPGNGIGQNFPQFTAEENLGKQLFTNNQGGINCAACHQLPTFSLAANSRSNGLDAGETTLFKSPSLKNVASSAQFMHDGRFSSLEEVVEFYNSGIQNGPALDNRLRTPNGQPIRMNLTQTEKNALVAFMRTLTDENITVDPKFSNPFIN
ncbi:cytochrome-c peroxidase [Kordia zhangzhouensis]|uniref:cytochrome-c peroxidase n=1 Tax=Kordia zhangzhouensis TaxID=1620405 RepID=UPI00069A04DF|nr:cytochrome c peroxidase [Kordia zhangzhouensis]